MLTALRVLEILSKTSRNLDDLTSDLRVYPQVLVNVRVKERKPLSDMVSVQREIQWAENSFGDGGRVVVRFSGTEPLARVMVEGVDQEQVQTAADRIAGAIRAELGG
jgi:phosphoglucosamine mutase